MSLQSPPEIRSRKQLLQLQRVMTRVLFRPLSPRSRMQSRWVDGQAMTKVAGTFIKPNDRLTSLERLEIYNRQYWFRVLDSLYEDYPGLRAVLGEKRFLKVIEAYLVKHPSRSFTMRNLGSRLETFLRRERHWAGLKQRLALEVVRFEWAQIVAFDAEAKPAIGIDDLSPGDPEKVTLGVQPYVSLLALHFPIDDFVLALKRRNAMRGEASNAKQGVPQGSSIKRVALPKPRPIYVAVHRQNNALYYKRLEPEAYALLSALRKGMSLGRACERALRHASLDLQWSEKVKGWFENWSAIGWFCQP